MVQKSNDHFKWSYSFDDCDVLTEKSVSICSQHTFKTYPFVKNKKNVKLHNSNFEYALSTTCSAEKTKTFLKKRNNVTNSLLDTTKSLITNISDSNFKNSDSDNNYKRNIDNKFT